MEQLAACDVEMCALTQLPESGEGARHEQAFGGRVIRFRVFGGLWLRDIVLSIRAGWWLLVHSQWDLLHLSGFSYFGVLPVLVAKLKGRPVLIKTTVLGRNGAFNPGNSWIARKVLGAYARADAIVALSQALEDSLLREDRITCQVLQVPNGVDIDLFRPKEVGERERAREAFGLPLDATVIVTCSMLYPRKNVIALVRAAAAMKTRPLCVVMAGPRGPDAEYLRQLDAKIAELPEGVEVRLLGALESERLAELLRAADIYALMSRAEGLPNTLLEGMATGLACVVSDIPGSADVLADGGGLLVPLDDDASLVAVLDRLAEDASERARLGAEARSLILSRYAFARIASRYRQLYDSLLDQRSDSPG
jgi:glycosyltransferase involved in cell wall biosynthesis